MIIRGVKIVILFIFGALVFASGFYLGEGKRTIIYPEEDIDFSLFWDAYYELKDNFLKFDEVDDEDIVHGAITGMIDALGDPHTAFFDKEESKMFQDRVSGKFEGVGMEIGIREDELQVISPIKGTPAKRAGIQSGDRIKSIDEETTKGMSLEHAVSRIRGPKGEEVTLEIVRNGEEKKVAIVRDVIQVPSISWEIKENDIVYIQFYYFHAGMTYEFSRIAREIESSEAKRIIIDVRGNPGGSLSVVVSIADWFLEKGEVVVISKKEGEEEKLYASGNAIFLEYPIVVLVNKGSASGSEILAGALRDNRGVKIVGETSFGKGSIQSMHNLHDGSSLKITKSYWLTPNGLPIEEKGIVPDFEVEMTKEDFENEEDPQLKKAIEIIKEL